MFAKLLQSFLSEQCYTEMVEKSNYKDQQCLTETATTGLGAFIMLLSAFMKVPQLLKILKNRNGHGISMSAVYTELFAFTSGAAYAFANNYPFSAWGEGLILAMQQFAISTLLLSYGSSINSLLLFTACYTTGVAIVAVRVIPLNVFWFIKACSLPMMLSGKLMQCSTNHRNKSTGQLSAVSCALAVLVCAARLFTSAFLTADSLLIVQFSMATLANSLILAQVLLYWKPDLSEKLKNA